jgi:hypothetical protein
MKKMITTVEVWKEGGMFTAYGNREEDCGIRRDVDLC